MDNDSGNDSGRAEFQFNTPPPPPKREPRQRQEPPPRRNGHGCLIAGALLLFCALGGLAIFLALALVGLIGGGVAAAGDKTSLRESVYSGKALASDKIALIYVKGIILSEKSKWAKVADAETICEQLELAANDKRVKGVLLYIDSPGGGITATDKIYHYVQQVKEAGKPVVSLFDTVAASGGYYVAANSDWIVANRMTVTGSIGVIVNSYNYYQLLQKVGVQNEVYKSKPFKDLLNPARPRTPEEAALVQSMVTKSYDIFVDVVAKGRPKLTAQRIKDSEIGDGRIFYGYDALRLNLVDELGYFDEAEAKVAELAKLPRDSYKIVSYQKAFSLGELFTELASPDRGVKLELPGADQWGVLEPGRFYYLYSGF